ncbi:uncharacterized protein LOC130452562 isoform X1 [Diorhabda sublineata]|uniref:uncharacterized protein LOC130452562 isoform X1 n=1 Tax=Diorhabda sublineata TaxID=1163346 RepID=UPI0024E0AF98|nr:uncharacterized protein LOC130452562 isoform X1 [Diorhabda sublineata]
MEFVFKDENDVTNNIQIYSSRVSTPLPKQRSFLKHDDTQYEKFCDYLNKPQAKLKILLPHKYGSRIGLRKFDFQKIDEVSRKNAYKCVYSERSTKILGHTEIFPKRRLYTKDIPGVDENVQDGDRKTKYKRKWKGAVEKSRKQLSQIVNIFDRKSKTKLKPENMEKYVKLFDIKIHE